MKDYGNVVFKTVLNLLCRKKIFNKKFKRKTVVEGMLGKYISRWAFFFSLKRLKTYLRNTTGQSRLNTLALMNIHRDIPLSNKKKLMNKV
jgi:hypothetical protein